MEAKKHHLQAVSDKNGNGNKTKNMKGFLMMKSGKKNLTRCIWLMVYLVLLLNGCVTNTGSAPAEPAYEPPAATAGREKEQESSYLLEMHEIENTAINSEERASEIAAYMMDRYAAAETVLAKDCINAVLFTDADFCEQEDQYIPSWVYYDLPFNMYVSANGSPLSNIETMQMLTEGKLQQYAELCCRLASIRFSSGEGNTELSEGNKLMCSDAFLQKVINGEGRDENWSNSVITSDKSLVYTDGDANLRCRILAEMKQEESQADVSTETGGKWFASVIDVVLYRDNAGLVSDIRYQPLTSLWMITDAAHVNELNSL